MCSSGVEERAEGVERQTLVCRVARQYIRRQCEAHSPAAQLDAHSSILDTPTRRSTISTHTCCRLTSAILYGANQRSKSSARGDRPNTN